MRIRFMFRSLISAVAVALTLAACGVEDQNDPQVGENNYALNCREITQEDFTCTDWVASSCTCTYNNRGRTGTRYSRSCSVQGCPGTTYPEVGDCRYGSGGSPSAGRSCAP